MDLPEDAEGRIAIYTVEAPANEPAAFPVAAHDAAGGGDGLPGRLGAGLDSRYAAPVLAACLVVILLVGLLLLRR